MTRSIPEIAADLAHVFPHRFIWFPNRTCLRISVDGHHRTGGPCMDAFLEYSPHHGMVFEALSAECEARDWFSEHRRTGHQECTHHSTVSPDWDRTLNTGTGSGFAWSFAEAMLKTTREGSQ